MARHPHIEVYEWDVRSDDPADRRFGWRLVRGNGRVTSGPEQGFTRRSSAKRSAVREHPGVEVRNLYK
jgi:hypothetical protein